MIEEKTPYELLTDRADKLSQKIYEENETFFARILEEFKKIAPEDSWMAEEMIGALAQRMGTHIAYEISLLWCYKVRDNE